jgi:hypothetical protein
VERHARPAGRGRPGADDLGESENEYRFSGLLRLVAPLMPGAFRKQSRQHRQDFKAFAEHGQDVRESHLGE